jgi:RNA polymerase sigma factor (sigma-70 family)
MAIGPSQALHRDLDLIARSESVVGLSDAELLVRFADRPGDAAEAAFEAIVARHGPMVLGTCRGVLRHSSDADDAFQATFLVLVRKARSVRVADSLGPWLYGVARRVATKARSVALRRRVREAIGTLVDAEAPSTADIDVLDARPMLFEELDRLPEKYRSPVVLCHLEGLTHEEAASRLRWPVGTLSGRLSRARDLLRSRLVRRGISLSVAHFAGAFLPRNASAVPPTLLRSTVRSAATFAAGGSVPNSILVLTQGALSAMLVQKLKLGTIVATALAMLTVAAVRVSGQFGAGTPAPDAADSPERPQPLPENQKSSPDGLGVTPGFGRGGPLTIPTLVNDNFVAITPKDGRSVTAMIIGLDSWQEYRAPEGVRVRPVLGDDVLALSASGTAVTELAAFGTTSLSIAQRNLRGRWVRQALRQPVNGVIEPVVGVGSAYYHVGSEIYAYSATQNGWDTLHLDGNEIPKIVWGRTVILVEQDETLYVFSVSGGTWSKGLKVPSVTAK